MRNAFRLHAARSFTAIAALTLSLLAAPGCGGDDAAETPAPSGSSSGGSSSGGSSSGGSSSGGMTAGGNASGGMTAAGGTSAGGSTAGGAGGGETVEPLGLMPGCQPLLGGRDNECFLPYPSNFFMTDDASTPSGKKVVHTGAGKLMAKKGTVSADTTDWRPIDGYSRWGMQTALVGSQVTKEGCVGVLDDPAPTMTAAHPTQIIDAETGEMVPHFVDVDEIADEDEPRAIEIHPLVALKPKTRYVVLIHGMKGPDGAVAKPAEGFRRLRDKLSDPGLTDLAARFETDVFAVAEKAGVARADLQLAWDFTTGSAEQPKTDMLKVRELTQAWLEGNQPEVTITGVEEGKEAWLWKVVRGKVTVPLFMTDEKTGATLFTGPDGQVAQNGTTTVDFVVHIPKAVRDQFAAGRALTFGHGFFGSSAEILGEDTVTMEDSLKAVTFGIDWWGMSSADLDTVSTDLANEPFKTLRFTDRVHQAMANWMVVTRAIKTTMKDVAELKRPATDGEPGVVTENGMSNAGELFYDPSQTYFLGISQGHILGGTNAALNPDLERVALNVGGAAFTQLMFRAIPFKQFLLIMSGAIPSKLDQRKLAATLQPGFDRIDPATYAEHVIANKLPGSPADRRVLQQAGIGDTQVPNLGSFLHARLLGLPQVTPTPRAIFGLEQKAAPLDGSGFALYDLGVSDEFYRASKFPPKPNEVHGSVRVRKDVLEQMDTFFSTGQIVHSDAM